MRSMSVVGELDSFKWRSPGRKFHTLEALTYKKCYMVVRTDRPDRSSWKYMKHFFSRVFATLNIVMRTTWAPCKRTQHCWMLHVVFVCKSCCTLLRKVKVKLLSQRTTPNTFIPWTPKRTEKQCWIRLLSYFNIVGAIHAQFTHLCQHGRNNFPHCCVCFHVALEIK